MRKIHHQKIKENLLPCGLKELKGWKKGISCNVGLEKGT
jgi:hypothetical protein